MKDSYGTGSGSLEMQKPEHGWVVQGGQGAEGSVSDFWYQSYWQSKNEHLL